jgi:DNA-binding response OmpR family regulator
MRNIKILCVEDNPGDARLIKELLGDDPSKGYEFFHFESLDKFEASSKDLEFDVVLLDLSLGDSSGIDTFERMFSMLFETPIIVLTGLKDEALAEKTIQLGAQDYLIKDDINTALLTRSLRYAIDRYHLSVELAKAKQLDSQQREIENFDRIPKSSRSRISEQLLGIKSLREYSSIAFNEFSLELSDILEKAVEAKMYKTNYDISTILRDFADKLGHSYAGPQDVVELYSVTLKEKIKSSSYETSQVYLEEGRLVILMLMGYLVAFYRKYAPVNMIFQDQKNNKS